MDILIALFVVAGVAALVAWRYHEGRKGKTYGPGGGAAPIDPIHKDIE